MPSMSRILPNYYSLLRVPKNASLQQIKTSYYKLAKTYHPDIIASKKAAENKDESEDTGEMFKKISEAYHILKNEDLRRKYDFELKMQEEASRYSTTKPHTASSSAYSQQKSYNDFKNQYEYKDYDRRQKYDDPNHDFDYNRNHRYESMYQQYFHQRNVKSDTPFHSFRTPDGKWKEGKMSYKYDPYTNTHFYYHTNDPKAAKSFEEHMKRTVEEEYKNFYNMQDTFDSYQRSQNIPTIFGMRAEMVLAMIAVLAILYGLSQYTFTETYKPHSNVYDREDRDKRR